MTAHGTAHADLPSELLSDSESSRLRIVLGGQSPLFLDGLRLIIADDPHGVVVAQVTGGDALLEVLEADQTDAVLIDLAMCHLGGVPLLTTLRGRFPDVRILVLSHSSERDYVKTLLELGVLGFLPNDASTRELRSAVSAIASGHLYIHGAMADALAEALGAPPRGTTGRPLSPRQAEVLQLAADGMLNKQIATALNISVSTVKNHLRDAYVELGASGRTDAIAKALRLGLVE